MDGVSSGIDGASCDMEGASYGMKGARCGMNGASCAMDQLTPAGSYWPRHWWTNPIKWGSYVTYLKVDAVS